MNDKSSSKITVVIPNYNHGHLIQDCINALKEQDFSDYRALIIDDQSTDESVEIISKLIEDDCRFSLRALEKKSGLLEIQNEALANVDSEYILLAAADDYILPGFFSALLDILEDNPEIAFATTKSLIPVTQNLFVRRPLSQGKMCSKVFSKEKAAQQLLKTDFLYITGASLIRTKAFRSLGSLDLQLDALADGVHLRMLAATYGYAFVNQYGLVWRRSPNGISVSNLKDEKALSEKLIAARAILENCSSLDSRYGRRYVKRINFVAKIHQSSAKFMKVDGGGGNRALKNLIKSIFYFLYYLKFRPFGIFFIIRIMRSQRRFSYSKEGVDISAKRLLSD